MVVVEVVFVVVVKVVGVGRRFTNWVFCGEGFFKSV